VTDDRAEVLAHGGMGMGKVRAVCPTCGGAGAVRVLRAGVSTRRPDALVTRAALEACGDCRAAGSVPMPGRAILGSLRGLLDGRAA
jgi:hypothetical protein